MRAWRKFWAIGAILLLAGLSACAPEPAPRPAAFNQCVACHRMEPGRHGVGPSLAGVFGRRAGTLEGYRYSEAMKTSGIVWNEERLRAYLESPKTAILGNKEAFAGLRKPEDREAVIAYLRSPADPQPVVTAPTPVSARKPPPAPPPVPPFPDEIRRVLDEFAGAFKTSFPTDGRDGRDASRLVSFFEQVYTTIRDRHLTPIDDAALIAGARAALAEVPPSTDPQTAMEKVIGRMLDALGSDSQYLSEERVNALKPDHQGGIGIELKIEAGIPVIWEASAGTPADRAGLRPGDRLRTIDRRPTDGLTSRDVIEMLSGLPGTKVAVTIDRPGHPARELVLERAVKRVPAVEDRRDGTIGYIRIRQFHRMTTTDLQAALNHLKTGPDGPLVGLILDLRRNVGGLLIDSIEFANKFTDTGLIATIRSRRKEDTQTHPARPNRAVGTWPMVVLIDDQTAAGAEIVAAALRDNGRAKLVGVRSFGRGTIQTLLPIPGHGALRLTTAEALTPSGQSFHKVGVEPDIVVHWPAPADGDWPKAMGRRDTDPPYARAVALLTEMASRPGR